MRPTVRLTSRQPFLGVNDLSDEYVKTELHSNDDENEQLGQTEKDMNMTSRVKVDIYAYQEWPSYEEEHPILPVVRRPFSLPPP